MNAKQVIVMRKDLNMRKGKMVAQGAHASLAAVLMIQDDLAREYLLAGQGHLPLLRWEAPYMAWIAGEFTKVCVYVNSESDLLAIKDVAVSAGLPVQLIMDAGHTEFHGVPTYTCLAIGPTWGDNLDPITGDLPLL